MKSGLSPRLAAKIRRRRSALYDFDGRLAKCLPAGYVLAGVDEAGRGPLAGPVTASAVALDYRLALRGLNDSKKLSAAQREMIFSALGASASSVCVASSSSSRVDAAGILSAVFSACRRAVCRLEKKLAPRRVGLVIFDGNLAIPRLGLPQTTLVGGDGKSACVAAASVAAKVVRDRIMKRLDRKYPGYGFAAHKGYATRSHAAALKRLGPCPVHRRKFIENFI